MSRNAPPVSNRAPVLIDPGLYDFASIWPVAFTPDGSRLAYTYGFDTIRLWDFAGKAPSLDFSGITNVVQSVAIDPQRRWIAFGAGTNIQLWSLLDGTPKSITTHYRRPITSLQFSKDGETLMSAAEGDADAWDISTLKSKFGLHGNYRFGYCDSTRIGEGTSDGAVTLMDLAGNQTHISVPHSVFGTDTIALSPDAGIVASASQLGQDVKVWSVKDGNAFRTVSRSGYQMYSNLLFSPDGKYIGWGTMNGRVHVLDVGSGKDIQLCCEGSRFIGAIAFSADSRFVLGGGTGHEIKIWDLPAAWSGRAAEVATLVGHTGTIRSLAVTPDGRFLLSASEDGSSRIWDLASDQERAALFSLSRQPGWLAVTPEGLFDGTAAAINVVSWRVPNTNDVYPLDAFYNDFFHPGLAAEIFEGGHPVPCQDIATLIRLPGARIMEEERLLHIEVHNEKAVLCLPDRPSGQAFQGIDARVKGLPVSIDPDLFQLGSTPTCRFELELSATPAEVEINTRVSPVAASCRVPVPKPQALACVRGRVEATSVLHVQTIAVSNYPNDSGYPSLTLPVRNAQSIEEYFRTRASRPEDSYSSVEVWPGLYDSEARMVGISQRFSELTAKVKPDDVLLLFLSGHGRIPPGQEMFYFLPFDGRLNSEWQSALSTAMISDFVRNIPARRVIVLIDACQSGGALDSLAKIVDSKQEADRRLAGRPDWNSGSHVIAAAIPLQLANNPNGTNPFVDAFLKELKAARRSHDVCPADLASRIISETQAALKSVDDNQLPLSFSKGANFVIAGK